MRWRALGLCLMWVLGAQAEMLHDKDAALGEKSGRLAGGEFAESLTLKVKAGTLISVTASSTAFTPYLILTAPGLPQLDRKAEGGSASGAVYCGKDGDLQVVVTSEKAGQTGKFHLAVASGLLTDKLGDGCPTLESGEYYRSVPVWMPAGVYTVGVTSDEFDPYLILHVGELVTNVDTDLGDAKAARAAAVIKDPTLIGLQVTSHLKGEKGVWKAMIASGIAPLTPRTSKGQLEKGDDLEGGKWVDSYSVVAGKGHKFKLALTATGFLPTLVVYDAAGHKLEGHVDGGTVTVTLENPVDGTCQVVAGSSEAGKGGEYELTLTPA